METDFAFDGFKYAVQFTLDSSAPRREGMRAMTPAQTSILEKAVPLFEEWRKEQEDKLKDRSCTDCEEVDEGAVQCLTCAGVFCVYDWIDHMHFSMEEDPDSEGRN